MHTQGSGCHRCVGTMTHTHPFHVHLLVCVHMSVPVPGAACVGNWGVSGVSTHSSLCLSFPI